MENFTSSCQRFLGGIEKIDGSFDLVFAGYNPEYFTPRFPKVWAKDVWLFKISLFQTERVAIQLQRTTLCGDVKMTVFVLCKHDQQTVWNLYGEERLKKSSSYTFKSFTLPTDLHRKKITFEYTIVTKDETDTKQILEPTKDESQDSDFATFRHDMLNMLRNEKLCDVLINLPTKAFSAHRCVLASRSTLFASIFEKDEISEKEEIPIKENEPENFKGFLEFLYSGSIKFDSANRAINFLRISDKFGVKDLKAKSENFLISNLTDKNVAATLIRAHIHNAQTLKENILVRICKNPGILSDEQINTLASRPDLLSCVMKRIALQNRNSNN